MKRWLVAAVLAASLPAVADPEQDAAALYDAGKAHFDLAEYSQAIVKWKASYLLSKEPLLLFNIAQAYRLSGNCAEANRFYLTYQNMVPKPANAAELAAAMDKCKGIEPATGESGVDTPKPEPPKPEPPKPEPPKPEPPKPHIDTFADQGATLRYTGIAVAGAGVLAGGFAIVFAASAHSKANSIADHPAGTRFDPDLEQIDKDGRSAQTRARIFGVAGIAGIAAGGTLWWLGHSRANVRIDASLAPRHSEVTLTCAF